MIMEDDNEPIKAFQLVEFDPQDKRHKRGTIESVPSTWISYNPSTGRCQCKFMPPPYSPEDSELLCSFVKERCPPPESWPDYPITLKGHATSYDDAMKRLTILEDEKFAYTEDGTLPEKKSEAAKKAYQRIKVKADEAIVEELMQQQPMNDNLESGGGSSCEISDSISLDNNNVKAKKKFRRVKNVTETESTDENSNVIDKPRKKPMQKSKFRKNSSKPRGHGSSIRHSQVKETLRTSSNNRLLSYASKAKNSTSQVSRGPISASNSDQQDKVEAKNSCRKEAVVEKSKPPLSLKSKNSCRTEDVAANSKLPPSLESSNNHEKTESKQSRPSVSGVSKYTENVVNETSSKLNQKDRDLLSGVSYDVQALTKAIDELKGIVKRSVLAKDAYGANVQSFATQYDMNLPVTNLEDFDAFDEKLKVDKKFRKEFASTLHFMFDHNATLPKNITALLRKNISRDVALNFTAVKAGKGKRIFKDTKLCGILLDVLLLKYKDGVQGSMTQITEKSFYRELGNCLSNAIDWDGNRKTRSKKHPEDGTALTVPQEVCVSSHSPNNRESSHEFSDKST